MSRHDEDIASDYADWSGFDAGDDDPELPEEYPQEQGERCRSDHGGSECGWQLAAGQVHCDEPPF